MNIELHIDELILHGFPPRDRSRIGERLRHELSVMVTERGLPSWMARGARVAQLSGGDITVAPIATPGAIGGQLAEAVYGGLQR